MMQQGIPTTTSSTGRPCEKLFHCDLRRACCSATFYSLQEFAEHVAATDHCLVQYTPDDSTTAGPAGTTGDQQPQSPEPSVGGVAPPMVPPRAAKTYAPNFLLPHLSLVDSTRTFEPILDLLVKHRGLQHGAVGPYVIKHQRYRCADCACVFFTWELLKEHMRAAKHCEMKCADCGELLSWDANDDASPANHRTAKFNEAKRRGDSASAATPLHCGVVGYIRTEEDFFVVPPGGKPAPLLEQYQLAHPALGNVVYPHKIFHLCAAQQQLATANTTTATCMRCRSFNRVSADAAARHMLDSGHENFSVQHYPEAVATPPSIPALRDAIQPVFMFQCPECFALKRTYAELARHMTALSHAMSWCGGCQAYIHAAEAMNHFQEACPAHERAYHAGYPPIHPKDTFVAIDQTDEAVVELVDQPDELVDPAYGVHSTLRVVYQCSLETCLRCFGEATHFAGHLNASKHGIYTCPACDKPFKVWEREFQDHIKVHPVDLPPNSHLAGKTCVDDFIVSIDERDAQALFPNYFHICDHCDMVVNPKDEVIREHERRECPLRRRVLQEKWGIDSAANKLVDEYGDRDHPSAGVGMQRPYLKPVIRETLPRPAVDKAKQRPPATGTRLLQIQANKILLQQAQQTRAL